jgi:hypothetical protein
MASTGRGAACRTDGGLLEVKQPRTGLLERDATGDECIEDLAERKLDIGTRFRSWKTGAEDVSTADGAAGVLQVFLIALMAAVGRWSA